MHAVIIWHHYNKDDGKIKTCSAEKFKGSSDDLVDKITRVQEDNMKETRNGTILIVHQVIVRDESPF